MAGRSRSAWLVGGGVWLAGVMASAIVAVHNRGWVLGHPGTSIAGAVFCVGTSAVVGFGVLVSLELYAVWAQAAAEKISETIGRFLSRYRRTYLRYLSERFHDVDMRGLTIRGSYTFSMKQVFVDLRLLPTPTHQASNGLTRPQPVSGAVPPDGTRRMSVVAWLALSRFSPLVIVGAPGSGKTTLIKHVTLTLCQSRARAQLPANLRSKIPVVVVLREVAHDICKNPDVTLAQVVNASLSRLPVRPSDWLDHQLRRGRCVVMFDGLDEVSRDGDRATVVRWVQEQINHNLGNYFVLTSRPKGYSDHPLDTATVVEVQPFAETQIEEFIVNWYSAAHERATGRWDLGVAEQAEHDAEDLFGRLREKAALLDLSANPLLLTMVALVHFYRGALPGSRVELYREICQVFLGKRQESKGIQGPHTADQKEMVLRVLAYSMMCDGARECTVTHAGAVIQDALARVQYDSGSREFLEDIERDSGILVERENGIYSFAHLTFQEYLAAAHVHSANLVGQMCANVADPWWTESILLYVAQADAAPIVAACLSSTDASQELFMLAADCINDAKEISPQLTQYLDSPSNREIDIRRGRRLMQVMLLRKVRNSIRLSGGGYLCLNPVTNREYRFFLSDSGEGWRTPDHWASDVEQPANATARGIRRTDVESFVTWVAGLQLDIRLPTVDELQQLKTPPTAWARQPDGRIVCTTRSTPSQPTPALSNVNLLHIIGDDYYEITSVSRANFSARLGSTLKNFAQLAPEAALLEAVHNDLVALATSAARTQDANGLLHVLDAFTRTWGRHEQSSGTPHFYPVQVIERSRQLVAESATVDNTHTTVTEFFTTLEQRLRHHPADALHLDDPAITATPDTIPHLPEITRVLNLARTANQAALDRQARLPRPYRQKVRAIARLAYVDALWLQYTHQTGPANDRRTPFRQACEQQLAELIILERRIRNELPATETILLVRR